MLTTMRARKLSFRIARLSLTGAVFIELCATACAETTPPTPLRAPKAPQVELVTDPRALVKERADKARDVLKRHCARCHERGQLQQALPAAGIGNILDLAALARRRDLIRPGYPDASPLFLSMRTRRMPFDVFQQLKPGAEPSAAEIKAVHDWIEGLPKPIVCERKRSDTAKIKSSIEKDLQRLGPVLAKGRRYVSLRHMLGRCGNNDVSGEVAGYRQAVAKLLNLLSSQAIPVRPQPVDEQGLVFGFDLGSLGWTGDQWAEIERRYQAPVPASVSGKMRIATNTQLPVLPADWFAHEAMKPDIYDNLVGLPSHISALRSYLGVSLEQDAGTESTAVTLSKVTGGARSILSFESLRKTLVWLAQDFAAAPASSPDHRSAKESVPKLVQNRIVFQLPNGFPGFAVYGAQGSRRSSIHIRVLPADLKAANADRSGLHCLSCHAMGPSQLNEQSRTAGVAGEPKRGDPKAVEAAFRQVGIDPEALIEGHDPVIALALRYARDLSFQEAAAELDLDRKSLTLRLQRLEGELQPVARRLLQGLISRQEFVRLSAAILPNSSLNRPHTHPEPLRLSIWSGRDAYDKNDVVRINAAATAPCRLTLISVNANGDAAVLFPNEFHKDNRLQARHTIQVPDPKDGFRLRAADPGDEAVVGICMAGDRESPPGIQHNFKLQRFTLLGNWRDHLDQALSADAAERKQVGTAAPKKKRRRSHRRKAKPLPKRSSKLPLAQARAMIVIGASPDKNAARASQAIGAINRSNKEVLGARD